MSANIAQSGCVSYVVPVVYWRCSLGMLFCKFLEGSLQNDHHYSKIVILLSEISFIFWNKSKSIPDSLISDTCKTAPVPMAIWNRAGNVYSNLFFRMQTANRPLPTSLLRFVNYSRHRRYHQFSRRNGLPANVRFGKLSLFCFAGLRIP